MKEYNKDGIKFNYKESLTEEDFITLIKSYIEIFNNGLDGEIDNIVGLHKNPILADRSFNMNLGNLCIENFDAELHTKIFNKGIYNFLREDIIEQDTYQFEGHFFTSFKNYNLYLTQKYGNYQKNPKKEEQITHHQFHAYWKDGNNG